MADRAGVLGPPCLRGHGGGGVPLAGCPDVPQVFTGPGGGRGPGACRALEPRVGLGARRICDVGLGPGTAAAAGSSGASAPRRLSPDFSLGSPWGWTELAAERPAQPAPPRPLPSEGLRACRGRRGHRSSGKHRRVTCTQAGPRPSTPRPAGAPGRPRPFLFALWVESPGRDGGRWRLGRSASCYGELGAARIPTATGGAGDGLPGRAGLALSLRTGQGAPGELCGAGARRPHAPSLSSRRLPARWAQGWPPRLLGTQSKAVWPEAGPSCTQLMRTRPQAVRRRAA